MITHFKNFLKNALYLYAGGDHQEERIRKRIRKKNEDQPKIIKITREHSFFFVFDSLTIPLLLPRYNTTAFEHKIMQTKVTLTIMLVDLPETENKMMEHNIKCLNKQLMLFQRTEKKLLINI